MLSTKPTLSQARRLSNLSFISGVKRHSERDASFREAIERLADKGIVIEAWMRTSPGGIDLITLDARVIVASIDTYRKYSSQCAGARAVADRARISESDVATNVRTSRSTPN